MEVYAVPLAAIIISVATLLLNVQGQQRLAKIDALKTVVDSDRNRMTDLIRDHTLDRERIGDLEIRIRSCEGARLELASENLRLMKQLLRPQNEVGTGEDRRAPP